MRSQPVAKAPQAIRELSGTLQQIRASALPANRHIRALVAQAESAVQVIDRDLGAFPETNVRRGLANVSRDLLTGLLDDGMRYPGALVDMGWSTLYALENAQDVVLPYSPNAKDKAATGAVLFALNRLANALEPSIYHYDGWFRPGEDTVRKARAVIKKTMTVIALQGLDNVEVRAILRNVSTVLAEASTGFEAAKDRKSLREVALAKNEVDACLAALPQSV
jgi:hypothetical protein